MMRQQADAMMFHYQHTDNERHLWQSGDFNDDDGIVTSLGMML
jgi:hypothetical protein